MTFVCRHSLGRRVARCRLSAGLHLEQRALAFCGSSQHSLRVDGSTAAASLGNDLSILTKQHTQRAALHVVGQAGLVTALQFLAALRAGESAACFTLDHAEEEGSKHPSSPSSSPASNAGNPAAQRGGRAYSISLRPSTEWLSPQRRRLNSTLNVTEGSAVQGLAKALSARVSDLQMGQAVGLTVSLEGNQRLRWHKLAKAAHAVSRAYEWQVRPVKPLPPTRPFHCVAAFVCPEGEEMMDVELSSNLKRPGTCFRIDVIPQFPSK
eukprot:TRINITY_DN33857_c0_g1_i1.p1 TRINITY_DN33857_c0_g1~~TRINITY_DN33857_c0_g1_i1.p1  ORF type:complete len:266 (-),score=39.50 TRINITY_DN33857_c0_g1_i1:42-839(-)